MTRPTEIIPSRPRNAFAGDSARIMTGTANDDAGTEYPVGTVFQPSSVGYDNLRGSYYQSVVIDGRRVNFVR